MATRTKAELESLIEKFRLSKTMVEISRDDFYNTLAKTDIIYIIENECLYPYVGIWKTRGGVIVAKTIPQNLHGINHKYYVPK